MSKGCRRSLSIRCARHPRVRLDLQQGHEASSRTPRSKCLADMDVRMNEQTEQMPPEEEGWEADPGTLVRLKNGSSHKLALVSANWNLLNRLCEEKSPFFSAMCDLKSGTAPDTTLLKELIDAGYVTDNNKLSPLIYDILDSGLMTTPEGMVLRFPVDLTQPGIVGAVTEQDALMERNFSTTLRELGGENGRGRIR